MKHLNNSHRRSRPIGLQSTAIAVITVLLCVGCSRPGANVSVSNCFGTLENTHSISLETYMTDLACDVGRDWQQRFQGDGKSFEPIPYYWVTGDDIVQAGGNCGEAGNSDTYGDDVSPAFACPDDGTVYLSIDWIRAHVWNQGGAMAVGVVIAHEVFHVIQFRLNIADPPDSPDVSPTELQADCAAGVWANDKYRDGQLEGNDIALAAQLMSDVGDYEIGDPAHHGTPDQRKAAFMLGYNTGQIGDCSLNLPNRLPEYSS